MKNVFPFLLSLLYCLIFSLAMQADSSHLLPYPQKFVPSGKEFNANIVRISSPVLQNEWEAFVKERGGKVKEQANTLIEVKLVAAIENAALNQEEAYRLIVAPNKITVEAVTERGVYWAMQTLAQLQHSRKKGLSFEGCTITDWPSFRIRGFLHDVGRRYMSMQELKKEIALLSKFKINVFHWHLTENQSWRLQSRIFPMLNDSVTPPACRDNIIPWKKHGNW